MVGEAESSAPAGQDLGSRGPGDNGSGVGRDGWRHRERDEGCRKQADVRRRKRGYGGGEGVMEEDSSDAVEMMSFSCLFSD